MYMLCTVFKGWEKQIKLNLCKGWSGNVNERGRSAAQYSQQTIKFSITQTENSITQTEKSVV